MIHIIGGGTVSHVRNHMALAAPAYGSTARKLFELVTADSNKTDHGVLLTLTKMADYRSKLETSDDVSKFVDTIIADPNTKIIFFSPALVDYDGFITTEGAAGYDWDYNIPTQSGKYEQRLKTSEGRQKMTLTPAPKVIQKIRKERKDIFLVAFKTTCGASEDEQFLTGLHLLKSNSCNLVFANDTKWRRNMIITPEQARYEVTEDRNKALETLVSMTLERAKGTFTRSTVLEGDSIDWNSTAVPNNLRKVVNYCISKGAYKPFKGSTVGHFAVKVDDKTFFTSKRKTNFNNLDKVGLVKVVSDSPDSVIAYGAKPSVGGQSQRIIFTEHPDLDCIVHFHCPPKPEAQLSVRQQKNVECGSHQCGKNTSDGLREDYPGIKAVYLDNHGPNIVFNRNMDASKVIEFIEKNFDLSKSTDQVDRSRYLVE